MNFTLNSLDPFVVNPALVWIEPKATPFVYNYGQVLGAARQISKVLRHDIFSVDQMSAEEFIGVMLADTPLIVPSILGWVIRLKKTN